MEKQPASLTVLLTCPECGSGIHIYPDGKVSKAECQVCRKVVDLSFDKDHIAGNVRKCPVKSCQKKDFYKQRDFNRKIGVLLFILASILSIFTYGLSFVVLYLFDFILHKKLKSIVICYHCQSIFRNVCNLEEIHEFNHEMNDRILYSGHDFEGKTPMTH